MCGIAGYRGPSELEPGRVESCLALMRRRGPDAVGVYRHRFGGGTTTLLHSRLGIIDLDERANQPFRRGSAVLALNGEIYNYRELGLGRPGLRTTSDTEILAGILAEEGPAGLERCEGMWALAFYDEADGSLTLSRDRFGEKPLYLYREGGRLYFGSEVKFIFALLGRRLPVNRGQMLRFLVNGYRSLYKRGQTFFQGLEELPSAGLLRLGADGVEESRRFWEPRLSVEDAMSYEDAVRGVRDRLFRSVELRLRADVPLAFCLSGGVDSNSLVAIAKSILGYDVHAFTILDQDERYEEREMVEQAVRSLGLRHTAIPLDTRDFLPRLRTLVRQHDAPVYTISYYTHWLLMESVHGHGYKVSVSGTAADELFSGYYDHHLAYLYEVREDPSRRASARRDWERLVKPLVRNPYLSDPELFCRDAGFRGHLYLDAERFRGFLTEDWSEDFEEKSFTPGLLRNRMLNELFYETVPVILHEDDLNAMYYSIENRSPYLDRDLFEFSCRIPTRHLVKDGLAKAILRDAMAGLVPDPVLYNPRKVGFNASLFSLLDAGSAEVRGEVLKESPIFEFVRRDKIQTLLEAPRLSDWDNKVLFYFLSCKMFLEESGG